MENASILIVDDDRAICANLRDILEEDGFAVSVAHNASSALALCADRTFDLCVIDLLLPDMPGTELIRKLKDASSTTEYIIITGNASLESAITAARSPGVVGYETKPLNIDHLLSLLKQATARRQAEQELLASEGRFRTCVESLLDGFAIFSAIRDDAGRIVDFRYEYINEAGCRLNQRNREEQIGHTLLELLPVHEDAGLFDEYVRVVETGQPLVRKSSSHKDVQGDGRRLARAFEFQAVKLDDGFAVDWRDVTEGRQMEDALRASEAKYRDLFEQSVDAAYISTREGRYLDVNEATADFLGYSREELLQLDVKETYYDPADRLLFQQEMDLHGFIKNQETTYRTRDGRKVVGLSSVRARYADDGSIIGYQGTVHDITERKRAEETMRASDEKYRAIFVEARDGIVLVDAETGLIADCNREFERQTGRALAELREMHSWELRPPALVETAREKFFQVWETGSGTSWESGFLRPDGEETPVELIATRVDIGGRTHRQCISRDITERRAVERQVRQAQLLASLGEMTAGIAHEVNNPLAAVMLYSELAGKAETLPQAKKDIKVIRSEAKRASNIMKDLLAYSRKEEPTTRRIDLQRVIRKVIGMRRYQDKVRNIHIAVGLAHGPLRVMGNAAQLTQVFMNLIVNAEEAIENSTGKRIVITTEKNGEWARISIADSGVGIPEENLTQVFVPFFSTKPIGKGTGLGLATCHGIVTAHGGHIRVEGNDMGGVTFIVDLPFDTMGK